MGEIFSGNDVELPALKSWNEYSGDLTILDLLQEERTQQKQKPELFLPQILIEHLYSEDAKEKGLEFPLIFATETDDVVHVLELLRKHNVSSVPVIDAKTNQVLGAVDMLDIVMFCTAKFSTRVVYLPEITKRQMQEFKTTPVKHLCNLSRRNFWIEMKSTDKLAALVQHLSHPSIHRVVIVDGNRFSNLITQSRFLAFLYRNALLFEVSCSRINDIFRKKNVICANENDLTIQAFNLIVENQVSGIGITDNQGALVGTLSARDLKNIDFTSPEEKHVLSFHELFQPCRNLMRRIEPDDPIQTVKGDETLAQVIKLVAENHLHRIFVVDSLMAPISILTLSDIIKQFVI